MAKKTEKTETAKEVTKPAVRRAKAATAVAKATPVAKAAAKAATAPTPARRSSSSRTKKAEAVSADKGLSAAVAVELLVPVAGADPSFDEIATRAYFIHLRRNGAPGNPDQDWMLAIDELRRERGLR